MKAKAVGISAFVYLGISRPSEGYSSVVPVPSKKFRFAFFKSSKSQPSPPPRKYVSSSEGSTANDVRRGWYQRVWSKVSRRPKEGVKMNMQAMVATEDLARFEDAFVFNSVQWNVPESAFDPSPSTMVLTIAPDTISLVKDFSFTLLDRISLGARDMSIDVEGVMSSSTATGIDRESLFVRFSRSTFQKILTERLDRWSHGTNVNTVVSCDPTSSLLQFLRGQFCCDASIHVDRISFGDRLRLSGGQLQAKNFCLNLLTFAPDGVPLTRTRTPRYPNQFDLVGRNFTFTQNDLCESALIRNGLRRILTRILKKRGLSALTVDIQSVKILTTGKISCLGQATMLFGPPVLFEVQTGIAMSSRGHIVTFPGLQISVNPSLGIFVPVIPEISVDLGHNAQLLDVTIDGDQAKLHLSARVTITPEHTLQLKQYIQQSQSYGALCSVDVGRWLTQVGQFAS